MHEYDDGKKGGDAGTPEPIEINVDEQRDPAIALWSLPATDEPRTFYYDETNNDRIIHLTDDGFNVPDPRPFVLGGVVHGGAEKPIDLSILRRTMGIQVATPEIKFEMVAKGDFLTILGSKKLDHFLTWLAFEGYLIHFLALDPVYYSYVDIVDSMPLADNFDPFGLRILKNDLYRVLRRDIDVTQDILRRYAYPAVAHEHIRPFLTAIIDLVEDAHDLMCDYHRMMLKGVLQSGRALDRLLLLDDTPSIIMQDLRQMFIHRICLFTSSRHILDEEDKISAILEGYRFVEHGMPVELFRFADSKAEPGVQLSDIVVGLLGACLTWLRSVEIDDIAAIKAKLSVAQNANRMALASLVERSIAVTDAFVVKLLSLDDIARFELFLE